MKLENKFLVVAVCLLPAVASMVIEMAVHQELQFTLWYSVGCAIGAALVLLGRRLIRWLERDRGHATLMLHIRQRPAL